MRLSTAGVVALSAALLFSTGASKSDAKIIDSVTENTSKIELGKGRSACQKVESTSSVKRAGQHAFKHWVDRCGERAEMAMKRTEIGKTYWYGWSMLIPSDWKDTSEHRDIVNQWAAWPTKKNFKARNACGAVGSYIHRIDDAFVFNLQYQGNSTDIECTKYTIVKLAEARGNWVDLVMQAKWTGNKDGFLKLWVKVGNGSYVQKIDYIGRTFWNDEGSGPYFKMGLYKGEPGFKGPAPRYLYTDEYRLGDSNSSFGQVAPRISKVKHQSVTQ